MDAVRRGPGPYLFVAETVFVYLEEQQVKAALGQIAAAFPRATIVLDTVTRLGVDGGNRDFARREMAARFVWACDDPASIEGWNIGLRLSASRTMGDVPEGLWPRLPWGLRANLALLRRLAPRLLTFYRINVFESV